MVIPARIQRTLSFFFFFKKYFFSNFHLLQKQIAIAFLEEDFWPWCLNLTEFIVSVTVFLYNKFFLSYAHPPSWRRCGRLGNPQQHMDAAWFFFLHSTFFILRSYLR